MGLLIIMTAAVLANTASPQDAASGAVPVPPAATPMPAPTPPPSDQLPPPPPASIPAPLPAAPGSPAEAADHPDIVVTARSASDTPDPFRGANAQAFAITDAVDSAIVGPIAMVYKKNVPSPIRSGIHNFLYNLREPVVFVNFVFQHKIGKAAETLGRFALNSTIGALGVIDMAKRKPFKLPRRGNGFADTLGFYGVPNGPFMFLPIVGPTTVRDLFGGAIDRLTMPLAFGNTFTRPTVAIPLGVLGALDHRADFEETLSALHDGQADPYANTRAFYLQRRQAEIDHLRGRRTGASSPMSEKPVGPIRLDGRVLTPTADPAAIPTVPLAPLDPAAIPKN
ncbi:MlaA family lipoprotein [Sphingomonas sp. PB4P5]|uniref:MlaA family lipoprotein n=1 Tax=Parasphingomonas puruogangriensis TaxID=3096155 RepID=UPI002FCB2DF2